MAFTRLENITRLSVQDWNFNYFKPVNISAETPQVMELGVQVLRSDGNIEHVPIRNVIARLQDDAAGQQHLANLINFRDYIQARLEAELLPL